MLSGQDVRQRLCNEAHKKIKNLYPESSIYFLTADLSSLRRVKSLADEIKKLLSEKGLNSLDVLINNAGTFSSWYILTDDGFELQFAVNHLAPFLLTYELLPLLKSSPAGRIITVSSGSHYHTGLNWKDIMLHKHYNCLKAYKQTKLANVLFTCELNRRLGSRSSVRAFAADPGLVNTEMGLKGTSGIVRLVWAIRKKYGTDPSVGASTSVYLASEASIQNSNEIYWANSRPKKASSYALRGDAGLRLWKISEKMCGIKY